MQHANFIFGLRPFKRLLVSAIYEEIEENTFQSSKKSQNVLRAAKQFHASGPRAQPR